MQSSDFSPEHPALPESLQPAFSSARPSLIQAGTRDDIPLSRL